MRRELTDMAFKRFRSGLLVGTWKNSIRGIFSQRKAKMRFLGCSISQTVIGSRNGSLSLCRSAFRINRSALVLGLMLMAANAAADEAAFGQCIDDPMQGFLRLLTLITVVSLVVEHWIADFLFGGRLPQLRSAAVVLGKRLVPWMGAVILILLAIPVAKSCLPLL